MGAFSSGRRRGGPSALIAPLAGALLLTALFAPASLAAAPNPSYGSATVDGATGDWDLGADFFADMIDAGEHGDVRAKLYLRYDCEEEVLYGLVLAQNGEKARQDRPDEAYIAIDGSKLITPDGDFAWVNGDGTLADGWEGAGDLVAGSYTIRAHVLIADDSADGYTPMDIVGRNVPLEIECTDVEPTDEEPTDEEPTDGNNPPPPPGGGVAPTTGTRNDPTLPPTDTVDAAATQSSTGGLALVLVGLAAISGLVLMVTRPRRRATVTVEDTIGRR
jgi:hypothetical protein